MFLKPLIFQSEIKKTIKFWLKQLWEREIISSSKLLIQTTSERSTIVFEGLLWLSWIDRQSALLVKSMNSEKKRNRCLSNFRKSIPVSKIWKKHKFSRRITVSRTLFQQIFRLFESKPQSITQVISFFLSKLTITTNLSISTQPTRSNWPKTSMNQRNFQV
jgi:hypothetical protein